LEIVTSFLTTNENNRNDYSHMQPPRSIVTIHTNFEIYYVTTEQVEQFPSAM
jgi:hypothetical protein